MAIVFQDYSKSLFPWLTLEKNVSFGLRATGKKEARERAQEALTRVELEGYARHYPWQVSGGMQQRAAIARALAREARLIILDEPFAAVNALTRMKLEDTLLGLWQEFGFTTIFVTHDVDEAIYLADRVIVLSPRPASIVADLPVHLDRPAIRSGLAPKTGSRHCARPRSPASASGPGTGRGRRCKPIQRIAGNPLTRK